MLAIQEEEEEPGLEEEESKETTPNPNPDPNTRTPTTPNTLQKVAEGKAEAGASIDLFQTLQKMHSKTQQKTPPATSPLLICMHTPLHSHPPM